jgi:hypothetical protein
MLDIRPLAWLSHRWFGLFNPFFWRYEMRRINRAGAVADWLHNLALFSALELVGFDEERFWHDYRWLSELYPEIELLGYRAEFERELGESSGQETAFS